jgi:hypothetical protein
MSLRKDGVVWAVRKKNIGIERWAGIVEYLNTGKREGDMRANINPNVAWVVVILLCVILWGFALLTGVN